MRKRIPLSIGPAHLSGTDLVLGCGVVTPVMQRFGDRMKNQK